MIEMVSQWKKIPGFPDVDEWEHNTRPYTIKLFKTASLYWTSGKPKDADLKKFYVQWYKKMFSEDLDPQEGRYFPNKRSAMTYVKSLKKRINNF